MLLYTHIYIACVYIHVNMHVYVCIYKYVYRYLHMYVSLFIKTKIYYQKISFILLKPNKNV